MVNIIIYLTLLFSNFHFAILITILATFIYELNSFKLALNIYVYNYSNVFLRNHSFKDNILYLICF